jgi:hypothetical protein
MRNLRWFGVAAMALLLAGCGTPRTIYYWGYYEPLIYTTYATPGKATPEVQVLKLEEDLQKAKAKNKPIPPGFHAHLGYLYFQLGKADQARQEFETEKANFAESAVFMDRLLANLNKP